jgi:hypothetical protein
MLRLCTYFTPTHEAMAKRFVLSRAWGFDDRRHIAYGQTCPSGEFKSAGWNDCMLDKLNTLINLPVDGMPTLYVDADVALMPSLVEWCRWSVEHLDEDEVAFSDDIIQWCAGIMGFRCTKRVHQFWQTLADLSRAWDLPDQDALHQLRLQVDERKGVLPIRSRTLPRDVFCNWATVSAPTIPKPWNGEPFEVPPTCLAWHANWTVGLANKQLMLERVVLGETSGVATQTA